jgi:formylglycine-generating enzyme required for sulfatase activity
MLKTGILIAVAGSLGIGVLFFVANRLYSKPGGLLGSKFTNTLGQVFVYLPPGTFEMGLPITETSRSADEANYGTHTVTLTQGYYMAIHETTQEPYQKITGEAPWKGQEDVREGADYPANYVSWDDAKLFIERLNYTERAAGTLPSGWEYCLPTEAQWEYAARAGTQTQYSFGDDASQLGKYAWFRGNAWDVGEQYVHLIGKKLPNKWGLYDMAGNISEWTADWYGDYPEGPVTNPTGSIGGSARVIRGGSIGGNWRVCLPAFRSRGSSGDLRNILGFRLALVQVSSQLKKSKPS